MADQFVGDPKPLSSADYAIAADSLGCSVAAIRAVAEVESAGGGFLADARPKILFERHVFHKLTGGRFGARHPQISSPRRGGYLGGGQEYARLAAGLALDRKAALEATSWGKFQLMGFNHASCGHDTAEGFVAAMVSGEPAQLAAFVAFIQASGLQGALMRQDWAGFARRYNGSGFAQHGYDRKMAQAYALFADRYARADQSGSVLRIGDTGHTVARLQRLLGLPEDGRFGPRTRAAVAVFQKRVGLLADGVVGRQTWQLLLRDERPIAALQAQAV